MNINHYTAITFTVAYIIFVYFTRKSTSYKNFSVANRSVGTFLIFSSLSANFIGPGFTLGLVSNGAKTGYLYLLLAGSYGIGKIIEGFFLAPKLRDKFDFAFSIGDVIAGYKSHNNKVLQLLVGLISFSVLIGLSAVMSAAAGEIFQNFFGIDSFWGIVIVTSIVTSYSIFGGIKSTMKTDAFQLYTMFSLVLILVTIIFFSSSFDLNNFSETAYNLTTTGFNEISILALFAILISWMFGETLMPFSLNTVLASKNSSIVKKSLVSSGVVMLIWLFIMLSLGIMAKSTLITLTPDQELLDLSQAYFKNGLFGLFVVALLGVIMSSQDALINNGSVVFSQDILNPFFNMSEEKRFYLSKALGVIIGFLSILFATEVPSIIGGLLIIYGVWIPSILVVLLFSIYLEKPHYISALLTIVIGASVPIYWNFDKMLSLYYPGFGVIIGTISSFLLYVLSYKVLSMDKR